VPPENHDAMLKTLAVMPVKAHANPDNVAYNLYEMPETGSFLFIETWKSKKALDKWLASPEVNSVFSPALMKTFTSAKMSGPWISSTDDKQVVHEEFTQQLNVDMASLWAAIDNMQNVEWIHGASMMKPGLDALSRTVMLDSGAKYTQTRETTDVPNTYISRGSQWPLALSYRSVLTLAARNGGTLMTYTASYVPADPTQRAQITADVHSGLESWFAWMRTDMKLK